MPNYIIKINSKEFVLSEDAKDRFVQEVQAMNLDAGTEAGIKAALIDSETILVYPER